jgi:hypothetical protein
MLRLSRSSYLASFAGPLSILHSTLKEGVGAESRLVKALLELCEIKTIIILTI